MRRFSSYFPEFPTGDGKIDPLVKRAGKICGLELKSHSGYSARREALTQAARYGKQLKLEEISLIFFVERVDDDNRNKLEVAFNYPETGVKVEPMFAETGE